MQAATTLNRGYQGRRQWDAAPALLNVKLVGIAGSHVAPLVVLAHGPDPLATFHLV